MERSVRDLLGGGLRPNDPRRFLIEAVMGAMSPDRALDPRVIAVIERQVAQHPLFSGLGPAAARTLVGLASDAVRFAGSAFARAPAIAKGLPARIHRLAAYGMAAEAGPAEVHLPEEEGGELTFLETLRIAMRIAPLEAEQITAAAHGGQLAAYLDDRYLRLKSLIPLAAEVFTLRALTHGTADDDHRFKLRDFFAAIPDLVLSREELDGEIYRAFRRRRAPDAQVLGELRRVAEGLPDPVDRYWMVVYKLVAEPPATLAKWRVIPFMGVMQAAFQVTDTDMELAVVDALAFPASLPRPS